MRHWNRTQLADLGQLRNEAFFGPGKQGISLLLSICVDKDILENPFVKGSLWVCRIYLVAEVTVFKIPQKLRQSVNSRINMMMIFDNHLLYHAQLAAYRQVLKHKVSLPLRCLPSENLLLDQCT